jgi:hypothetical protein
MRPAAVWGFSSEGAAPGESWDLTVIPQLCQHAPVRRYAAAASGGDSTDEVLDTIQDGKAYLIEMKTEVVKETFRRK